MVHGVGQVAQGTPSSLVTKDLSVSTSVKDRTFVFTLVLSPLSFRIGSPRTFVQATPVRKDRKTLGIVYDGRLQTPYLMKTLYTFVGVFSYLDRHQRTLFIEIYRLGVPLVLFRWFDPWF